MAGSEGRGYDLGPDVRPGDIDARDPAVVAWCDGELFYLLASGECGADALRAIAESIYLKVRASDPGRHRESVSES